MGDGASSWLVAGLVALGAVGVGAYLLGKSMSDDERSRRRRRRRRRSSTSRHPAAAGDLGFPAFATKNTTRVAGVDPIADAAGVALAVFPSTGDVNGPGRRHPRRLQRLGDGDRGGEPGGGSGGSADPAHRRRLDPGADRDRARGARAGGVGRSRTDTRRSRSGPRPRHLACAPSGSAAATRRSSPRQSTKLRQTLSGERPAHVLLVSLEQPQLAMPAAAWAARSGDPVLFVHADSVPKPTLARASQRPGGPGLRARAAVGDLGQGARPAPQGGPRRQAGRGGGPGRKRDRVRPLRRRDLRLERQRPRPRIRDRQRLASPGRRALPRRCRQAATGGRCCSPTTHPGRPRRFATTCSTSSPATSSDPTRAVYNHIWLIGDQDAISVGFQAQVDDLAEVAQVRSGTGPSLGAPPEPGANTSRRGHPSHDRASEPEAVSEAERPGPARERARR